MKRCPVTYGYNGDTGDRPKTICERGLVPGRQPECKAECRAEPKEDRELMDQQKRLLAAAGVCACDELLITVTDEETGAETERRLPPPPGHSCEYVRRRNALIPTAWWRTREGPGGGEGHARRFFAEMDRMVAALIKSGDM